MLWSGGRCCDDDNDDYGIMRELLYTLIILMVCLFRIEVLFGKSNTNAFPDER